MAHYGLKSDSAAIGAWVLSSRLPGELRRPDQITSVCFADGRLDTPKVSGVAPELSRYLGPTSAAWFRSLAWWSVMSGNIFNSNGAHVGVVDGAAIFDLKGQKLYHLKGINIYRLSGELVGHLNGAQGSDKRLDRSADKLFPARGSS